MPGPYAAPASAEATWLVTSWQRSSEVGTVVCCDPLGALGTFGALGVSVVLVVRGMLATVGIDVGVGVAVGVAAMVEILHAESSAAHTTAQAPRAIRFLPKRRVSPKILVELVT